MTTTTCIRARVHWVPSKKKMSQSLSTHDHGNVLQCGSSQVTVTEHHTVHTWSCDGHVTHSPAEYTHEPFHTEQEGIHFLLLG